MHQLFATIDKVWHWLILIGALSLFIFLRGALLPFWERMFNAMIGAALAIALTEEVAAFFDIAQLLATILIMLLGPAVLNAMFAVGQEREFLVDTLKAWFRKWLGVTNGRDGN